MIDLENDNNLDDIEFIEKEDIVVLSKVPILEEIELRLK